MSWNIRGELNRENRHSHKGGRSRTVAWYMRYNYPPPNPQACLSEIFFPTSVCTASGVVVVGSEQTMVREIVVTTETPATHWDTYAPRLMGRFVHSHKGKRIGRGNTKHWRLTY